MKISILTVFPELYEPFLKTSLIGRARQKGIIETEIVSFFNFAQPKERIDSPSFGPGAGMLLKPEIVQKAIEFQEQKHGKSFKIFFTPQGKKLNQKVLEDLKEKIEHKFSHLDSTATNLTATTHSDPSTNSGLTAHESSSDFHLLLVASRYEGMDSRVEQFYADELISIGDFVLMGGDLPAMCFLEAFLRLIPGVVGKTESVEKESFSGPFLDYPEYTAPVVWNGMEVPEIVRSGNHALIDKWRLEKAIINTIQKHFDWLRSNELNRDQIKQVSKFLPAHYVALMHGDVVLKDNQSGTTSVTSLDIHDIARSCATYGIKNYFICTPLEDQKKIVKTLLDFWQTGFGVEYNVHRHVAVNKVKLSNDVNAVVEEIKKIEGKEPIIIATSAKKDQFNQSKYITYNDQDKVWQHDAPVLFLFGTGHGISKHILDRCDYILEPIYGFSDFNHLSVRSATAVILDRWLGINLK